MKIVLNGKEEDVAAGVTIRELLEEKGLRDTAVVVEHNRTVIPAEAFSITVLHDGDELEILHFVGGG